MATIDLTIARIREFSNRPKWSKFRLAREARLSPNSLRDLDKPDWNPTTETIRAIEAVIDEHERAETAAVS